MRARLVLIAAVVGALGCRGILGIDDGLPIDTVATDGAVDGAFDGAPGDDTGVVSGDSGGEDAGLPVCTFDQSTFDNCVWAP